MSSRLHSRSLRSRGAASLVVAAALASASGLAAQPSEAASTQAARQTQTHDRTTASAATASSTTPGPVVARYAASKHAIRAGGFRWKPDASLRPKGHLKTVRRTRRPHGALFRTERTSAVTYRIALKSKQTGKYLVAFALTRCAGTHKCTVVDRTRHVSAPSGVVRVKAPRVRHAGVAAFAVRSMVTQTQPGQNVTNPTPTPTPGSPVSLPVPVSPVTPIPVPPVTPTPTPVTPTPVSPITPVPVPPVTPIPVPPVTSVPNVSVQEPPGGVFGPLSVWHTPLTGAPVASNSASLVSHLDNSVTSLYSGMGSFNVYSYGVAWYSVGADQPTVNVAYTNCQNHAATPKGLLGTGGQFSSVPIPDDAVPTSGTDGELSIYQASTDSLWDFWRIQHTATGWSACWGGHISNVSTSPGYFSGGWGMNASGLAGEAGAVSLNDAESGVIDHAITLGVPSPAKGVIDWPAQRTDGSSTDPTALPEGARLRLDPTVDIASLNLTPLAAEIARAAQVYGFVVVDNAGTVSIPAESGVATQASTGSDPWAPIMGKSKSYNVLKNFPWQDLQVIQPSYAQATTAP